MKRYEETEKLLKNDRKSTRKGSTEMGYGVTTALSGQIYFSENFWIPCIAFFLSNFIQWQQKHVFLLWIYIYKRMKRVLNYIQLLIFPSYQIYLMMRKARVCQINRMEKTIQISRFGLPLNLSHSVCFERKNVQLELEFNHVTLDFH